MRGWKKRSVWGGDCHVVGDEDKGEGFRPEDLNPMESGEVIIDNF